MTTAVAPSKKKTGRPSKLTPDVHEAIIRSLVFGASDFAACTAAGIAERTFYGWMERGQDAEDLEDEGLPVAGIEIPYMQFAQDVRQARGHAVSSAESMLFFSDPGAWLTRGPQARTRHDRDGWSQQVAVIAPSGGPDRIDTGDMLGQDIIEEVVAAIGVAVEDGTFAAVVKRRRKTAR